MLKAYLPRHNRRFTVSPQEADKAWVRFGSGRNLDEVFCFKYRRAVLNDNTVRIGKHIIDIPPPVSRAHTRVDVHERFDGSFAVYFDGRCIAKQIVAQPPATYRTRRDSKLPVEPPTLKQPTQQAISSSVPWHPPANHPWRRDFNAKSKAKAS